VERTFEILRDEMETCMKLLGVEKVSELGPKHVSYYHLHCISMLIASLGQYPASRAAFV
jgi:hypothetical protein